MRRGNGRVDSLIYYCKACTMQRWFVCVVFHGGYLGAGYEGEENKGVVEGGR